MAKAESLTKSKRPTKGWGTIVAVIVTWNKRAEVLRCIDSILASFYPIEAIVVVDNASTDGTASTIRQRFGTERTVQVVVNETNKGGSGGFYAGIEAASTYKADYLWLLDNDVIVEPEALARLVAAIEREPQVGIVGSKIYFANTPEIIWSFGARINHWLGQISVIGDKVQDQGQYNQILAVDYVPMCSMLISSEVLGTIGSVDPAYFVYSDDVDLCTRTKRAGFGVLSVPDSIVWHDVSLNSQRMSPFAAYYFTRNYIHYFLKFSPVWYQPIIALFLFLFLMRRLLATVKYWPGFKPFLDVEKATLAGFVDAWRGIRGQVY